MKTKTTILLPTPRVKGTIKCAKHGVSPAIKTHNRRAYCFQCWEEGVRKLQSDQK